jgi:hypothetical protein
MSLQSAKVSMIINMAVWHKIMAINNLEINLKNATSVLISFRQSLLCYRKGEHHFNKRAEI